MVLKDALVEKLGFRKAKTYENEVDSLISLYQTGNSVEAILNADLQTDLTEQKSNKLFQNIDGIKFLTHDMGCGGTKRIATLYAGC
jgi:altronate hydrolase